MHSLRFNIIQDPRTPTMPGICTSGFHRLVRLVDVFVYFASFFFMSVFLVAIHGTHMGQ